MVLVRTMETPPDIIDKGKMRINVYDRQQGTPLANARVSISYTGNPETVINEVMTDSEGHRLLSTVWSREKSSRFRSTR